jgi:hypothetical protein
MTYDVLCVDTYGKSSICYMPEDTLHDKYDIYAPINKKYHNLSIAILKNNYRTNEYIEPPNDTINEMFPEYGGLNGNIYLILDLELKPHELDRQYKRLMADVAYKRFL